MELTNNNENEKMKIINESLEKIVEMVAEIKYGSITLLIQNGFLIQIDRNEKIRIK